MTQHDQISSFIDNELSHDQEQDFLISLASSEGLRRTFRSELVLKNIVHRDEVLTAPSRDLRPAVLATIGIAAAATATTETAHAATAVATKTAVLKSLFATKLGAVVTASVVTVSALGGYAVRTYVASPAPTPAKVERSINTQAQPAPAPAELQAPVTNTTPADLGSAPSRTAAAHTAAKKNVAPADDASKPIDVMGSAPMTVNPPKKK